MHLPKYIKKKIIFTILSGIHIPIKGCIEKSMQYQIIELTLLCSIGHIDYEKKNLEKRTGEKQSHNKND